MGSRFSPGIRSRGFTLLELMISVFLMMVVLALCIQTIDTVQRTWSQTTGSITQFQEARNAFESMNRRISQATLNDYWAYVYDNSGRPTGYARQSELRFISGPTQSTELAGVTGTNPRPGNCIFFQAPLGYVSNSQYAHLDNLLNTWGYYAEWNSDANLRPPFLNQMKAFPVRYRFRLMELRDPSENLSLFQSAGGGQFPTGSSGFERNGSPAAPNYLSTDWFTDPMADSTRTHALAENVIGLSIVPEAVTYPNGPGTSGTLQPVSSPQNIYNTAPQSQEALNNPSIANQLPPVLVITMTAADETTFSRYQASRGSTPPDWISAIDKLFQSNDPRQIAADQEALEQTLTANKITFRVFTSQIAIPAARWSGIP